MQRCSSSHGMNTHSRQQDISLRIIFFFAFRYIFRIQLRIARRSLYTWR